MMRRLSRGYASGAYTDQLNEPPDDIGRGALRSGGSSKGDGWAWR